MGTSRSEFMNIQADQCHLYVQEHLTYFSNVKRITFFTLELVHQVGDGISKIGVRASELLGGLWMGHV